jgi:glucose-6-phosphate isomerase
MPTLLALLDIWSLNFQGATSLAILPYAHALRGLPAYLQQLMMESNGKHVTHAGEPVDYATGAIIWGGAGTNGQHAFHQLLFQGTHRIPSDFIVVKKAAHSYPEHQAALLTNAAAQAEALWVGQSEGKAYQHIKGGQPSNTLTLPSLTPATLGSLLALYEHRTFVQSVIWDINAFDQWGVELGKAMAAGSQTASKGA